MGTKRSLYRIRGRVELMRGPSWRVAAAIYGAIANSCGWTINYVLLGSDGSVTVGEEGAYQYCGETLRDLALQVAQAQEANGATIAESDADFATVMQAGEVAS